MVNVDPTSTSLISSFNPSALGDPVTFTATVAEQGPGTQTTSGQVTFYDGTTPLSTVTLAGGVATYTTSSLDTGTHSITAVYGGDTLDAGSTSSILDQLVKHYATTTALVSSSNPSVVGQNIVFTATVSQVGATPSTATGQVTFYDGANVLGTESLTGGSAVLSLASLTLGTHTISAVYGGDTNDLASTSTAVSQLVNQDSTVTSLTSSANPSVFDQSVTFTATVTPTSPGAGTPTGQVTFYDGTTVLAMMPLTGGSARFTTGQLAVATHAITAVYAGDTNDMGSTSSVLDQIVSRDATTTLLTSSTNPTVFGQPLSVSVTVAPVSPGAGTPTGQVTFYDGMNPLGTASLSGGKASFPINGLNVGTHTLNATYGGDIDDLASGSNAINQLVNRDATTTTLVTTINPSVLGESVTLTATVSVNSPARGRRPARSHSMTARTPWGQCRWPAPRPSSARRA